MNCEKWRDLASEYIEGTLAEPMATAMGDHVRSCASCQADESALRAILREINTLPEVDPPMFFHENVMAAIEREQVKHPLGPWWKTILPQVGRTAAGTLVAGGVFAAALFGIVLPQDGKTDAQMAGTAPAISLLPGTSEETGKHAEAGVLRISRRTSELTKRGPTFDFTFRLENADRGTVRVDVAGVKDSNGNPWSARFNLVPNRQETLQVPFDVAAGKDTIDLRVFWTVDGESHSRYIFLPIPREEEDLPREHQSFGLPNTDILTTAQEIASRYGVPISIDDVPEHTQVAVIARDETAEEALRRNLDPLGLTVAASRAGLLIQSEPQQKVETPATPNPKK